MTIEPVSIADVLKEPASGKSSQTQLLRMLRAIRSHLGMDVAFISQFAGGQRIFRHVDSDLENAPVQEGEGGPLDQSYCQRVVNGRLPQMIQDASTLPAALELEATKTLPVGAHMSVPIRLSDGSIYGTYCCFSFKPDHSLNDRDLAVMQVFADLTADQIEKDLADSKSRREVRSRIEEILQGERLTSVYQPLIDLETGSVVGFECLSRFPAVPQQGPDVWFAEAASAGLGIDLELRAVERAFAAFDVLPEHVYLAANVSPNAILSGKLAALLGNRPLARVVLELTEHETITDYQMIAETLRPLRDSGVRIAVDDAGAGYASFRHILRLQPDYIKLDRSLISNIQTDLALQALATAFIRFASDTGGRIVAEGVETREELETLRKLGVKKAQGYYFSKPLPLSAALALIGV